VMPARTPSSRAALSAVCMLLAGATACSHSKPAAPPTQLYSVEVETDRKNTTGALGNQSLALVKDAKQVLKRGRTVAFLPPDSCRTTSVAPNGASVAGSTIRMECGALLSGLEAEAARIGYTVVSWQALKVERSAAASIGEARSLGVEVLFEINELTEPMQRPGGQQEISQLNFFRDAATDPQSPRWEPMNVTPETASRCSADTLMPGEDWISTLNLKATEVSHGRAIWLYQHSVVEHVGEADRQERRRLVYADPGEAIPPPEPELYAMYAGGMLLGVSTGLLGALAAGVDMNDDDILLPLGCGAVGGLCAGGVINGVWWLLTKPTGKQARYADPGTVICNPGKYMAPAAAPAIAAAPTLSSSYTARRERGGAEDIAAARAVRLRKATTEEFARALLVIAGE
jgi:hypothetical protein